MAKLKGIGQWVREVRGILPWVLVTSLGAIALGFGLTILFLKGQMTAFYVNITAGIVVMGIGIMLVSFLLPTVLARIALRRARVLQENLLGQLEGFLIQWLVNFCSLAEGPEKLLRQLHPAKYNLPETPMNSRLTREMEPELRQWYAQLRLPETAQRYANFTRQQWQTILLNFGGYQWRVNYFKEQFSSLSASLPDMTEITFKLIQILDELSFPIPPSQVYVQNVGPVVLNRLSVQGERMFSMLDSVRDIMNKAGKNAHK